MGNRELRIPLRGRIDSNNAAEAEQEIRTRLGGDAFSPVLDASELEYISSAGLRVILRLKKQYPELRIAEVSSQVYEILETTGFTEMMPVEKAYRVVSVEGCEVVGEGFNGKVYRIDRDNVVKVYKNADALADIQHEREVARLALTWSGWERATAPCSSCWMPAPLPASWRKSRSGWTGACGNPWRF